MPIVHKRFRRVEREIFLAHLSPDCMRHDCKLHKEEDRLKLDACCQYGVDVDLGERDGILSHASQLREILFTEVGSDAWFQNQEIADGDFPSGTFVRTSTHEGGCVFLNHDARGCAIHRASIEGGWDFHGIKPHVCRLFPMSYEHEAIVISDDYRDYSCAFEPNTPTMYQVGRTDLQAIFGEALVVAMDELERQVLGTLPTRLEVLS